MSTTSLNQKIAESISIYPNPIREGFYVNGINDTANISIVDYNGKIIVNRQIFEKEYIPTSNLKSGCYLISITTKDSKVNMKIIIE